MPPPPNLAVLLVQMQFPGMPVPESDVARAWLEAHGHEYDRIEWNVRLGEGVDLGDTVSESTRRHALLVTQKRADLVAWLAEQPTIVEVKIRAGLGSIGQLLGYRTLWIRDRPEDPPPHLVVIARRVDDDTLDALHDQGIDVLLYVDRG